MAKLDLDTFRDNMFEFNHSPNFNSSSLTTTSSLFRPFSAYSKLVSSANR